MFLNECTIPEKALFDAALKRRIISFHPKRAEIEEDYNNRMAGYRGEKSLDYYLEQLPSDNYHIIHGLRLQNGNHFFQIDNLILAKSHLVPLEVKNWAGEIHFTNTLDQVIRISPDRSKRERVQNPILQAKMQSFQLKNWLARQGLGHLPIEYFFVNSNPKTIITTDPGNEHVLQRACTNETLIDKILQTSKVHRKIWLDEAELIKLGESLLAAHTPPQYDILKEFQISQEEILTGVHCPICFSIPMAYKSGIWHCSKCGHRSKTAHVDTINDHFLLIKPSITNAEVRRILQIPSVNIANKFLKTMKLPWTGSNKGRIYFKP